MATFGQEANYADLYSLPGIQQEWNEAYGADVMGNLFGEDGTYTPPGGGEGGEGFDIPTDLFPRSESGINWDSPVAQALLDQLIESGQNLPGLASSIGETLQNQYSNLMNQALGPEAFQGTMNELAAKGMLDSTVASNAMASTAKGIAQMVSDKMFDSMLAQQQQEMQVPGMLADLIGLAQESINENPLAPYELLSQFMFY
jgi:hypothetical protein